MSAREFLAAQGFPAGAPLVGMHVGSGPRFREKKRWPPGSFIALAERLRERFGVQIVLTGSQAERELTDGRCRKIPFPLINTAGKLTLRQTAALIKQCRIFISNDSGIAHMAAAVGTPLIVIFGPTNVQRIAPQGEKVWVLQSPSRDIRDVTPQEVLAQVEKIWHA